MEEDEQQGLVPFFVSTTLGTTGSCSFDALEEIGIALQRYPNVWLHVDAAYAGNAFICPELKYLLKVWPVAWSSFFFLYSFDSFVNPGHRIRGLIQHQLKQMAVDQFRLLHTLGARQNSSDFCFSGNVFVSAYEIFK